MKKCNVEGCDRKHNAKGLCMKHYYQIYHFGRILKRTKFEPNEIFIKNDIAEIVLYDKANKEKARAIVDIKDIEKVKNHKWYAMLRGGRLTPVTKIKGKTIYMSNIIMGFKSNRFYMIDHKNRNPLNNRRNNLRECTTVQNSWNQGARKSNKSGYKGICWHKKAKKWMVRIKAKDKAIYLGLFNDLKIAINTYNEAAIKYHGKFAYLNGGM